MSTIDKNSTGARIQWYRTAIDKETLAALNTRSDLKGWLQAGGCIGLACLTGGLVLYGFGHWPWWVVASMLFAHGTFFCPMSSSVHELVHRTVFKTKALNDFFVRFFSFFCWVSNETFHPSHMRHHQHTLHQPDDLEVVLPMKVLRRDFLRRGFIYPIGFINAVKNAWRLAKGRFEGEWELKLFPEEEVEKRRAVMRWGRTQLMGHALIVGACIFLGCLWSTKWFMVPVLTTLGPFYGAWLAILLGAPQHIGLQDKVADFRLCCRTYTAHPFLEFLYWNMNYHTEHHMYAAVPCYNLRKLHRTIKHDLPPCPDGLIATWKQIFEIMRRQEVDPSYQYIAPLPGVNAAPQV